VERVDVKADGTAALTVIVERRRWLFASPQTAAESTAMTRLGLPAW
jgi:hypothetical protein